MRVVLGVDSWRGRAIRTLTGPISLIRKVERYSLARSSESLVYRLGVALIVTSVFLTLRLYLGHLIDSGPYILLIAAVLVCALFAGAMAGIIATIMMALAQLYFFSQPYLSLSLSKLSGPDTVGVGTFVLVSVILNLLLWGRRSAKGVAAETEEQFKAAFNQAAVGMSYTDMEGKWIQVNQTYARLMGYSKEELKHKTFEDLTHPDDLEGSKEIMRRLISNEGQSYIQQKRYIRKDGSLFWADITISLVRDNFENPKYFVSVLQDVTAKREAEDRLRISEVEYRTIVETAEEGVWILDPDDKTKFVNNKMAAMLGYEVSELIGHSPGEFVDDESRPELLKHLELRHRGVREQYDLKWARKDGSALWTSISTTSIRTKEGEYGGALAMISDINRRKEFEKRIEYEHKRIYSFFAVAPALVAVLSGPDHVFEFANEIYLKSVGDRPDIIGKSLREALPELEGQGIYEVIDKVYKTGEPFVGKEMPSTLKRNEGPDKRFFNLVYQCSRNDQGEIDGVFVHAVDVTDHVMGRRALEQSRESLELAQKAGHIGTFEWNISTNEVDWSLELTSLYGIEPGGFGGKFENWIEAIYDDDREWAKAAIDQAVSNNAEVNIEFRINLPDGTIRWIAARGRIHYDAGANLKRMVGIQRNVSQRKRAESDLKFLTKASTVLSSSLNYETTLKNIATLAVGELADWCTIDMLNDSGVIERIAQATSSKVDPDTAEFLALPYRAYPEAKTGVPLVLRTGEPVLYQQLHTEELENLSQLPEALKAIEVAGFSSAIIVPIQILGWAAGAISLSLIGPQRRYDENDLALAESLAERASAAIDNAWLYKETQVAREELEQRVEQRTRELLSKNTELNEAQSISHLGSWEWDVETDERAWSAEMYRIYGLDPATFTPTTENIVEYSHPDDKERVKAEARAALLTEHGLFASEFRIVRPSGEERNLFGQGRVVKDPEGKVIRMVGTVLDITDRKKIEQMKTDFVSLVSHQLKTPLAIIKGYTDNILMGIAGDLTDKQRQYLREMQGITTKYYYLIADLLNVSRIERGVISIDARPVDLIEIARAAAASHSDRIKTKRLKLVFNLPNKPVIVLADQAKTMEAISNVIDNAIKFTDTGQIEIEAKTDKDFGSVTITDSGRGMNRETVGKLFRKDQVFSGSPTPEGGSGLGLYIAKEFIRYQGGDVAVTSELGRGSKFTFKVPLAKVKTGVK